MPVPAGVDVLNADRPTGDARALYVRLDPRGAQVQRSEVWWGERGSGRVLRHRAGQSVTWDFAAYLDLGHPLVGPEEWAVVWQLLGPTSDGSWPGPPLALGVSNGRWHLGGGAGRPGGSAEAYAPMSAPYRPGAAARWRITATLSPDPDRATVDAWLDGRQVVRAWHPPGGTIYATQPALSPKAGIYTGSGTSGPLDEAIRRLVLKDVTYAVTG